MKTLFLSAALVLCCLACTRKLPNTVYSAYSLQLEVEKQGDILKIRAENPLACPVIFFLTSSIPSINDTLVKKAPKIIPAYQEVVITFPTKLAVDAVKNSLEDYSFWTSREAVEPDTSVRYVFPFLKGRAYPVIQAYHGAFSHQSDFSAYAIDFEIPIGDTICAARDGIVVGVIEENEDWVHGSDEKYRAYANYLRLFHSDETFTDYVHLKAGGALVELGDTVKAGQPIAIAGYTGWTTTPHLHFNVIKPTGRGTLIGFPVKFEKIAGEDIKTGVLLEH